MSALKKVSGVIITLNEEHHISDCIQSLQKVVDEIVVVDSFSTDKTKEICLSYGVKFIENPFAGHIEQKNFAVNQASHDWVLALDADERLSKEMQQSIEKVKLNLDFDGYIFNRLNNYCGAWLRHSWYPDAKLRLWNKTKGQWGGTNPHDKVIVDTGKVQKLNGDIIHYAYGSVNEHLKQIVSFSNIAAEEKFKAGKTANFLLKIGLAPLFTFVKKYIFNLGFLDGHYGFVYCVMASHLNFMKYITLWGMVKSKK